MKKIKIALNVTDNYYGYFLNVIRDLSRKDGIDEITLTVDYADIDLEDLKSDNELPC